MNANDIAIFVVCCFDVGGSGTLGDANTQLGIRLPRKRRTAVDRWCRESSKFLRIPEVDGQWPDETIEEKPSDGEREYCEALDRVLGGHVMTRDPPFYLVTREDPM